MLLVTTADMSSLLDEHEDYLSLDRKRSGHTVHHYRGVMEAFVLFLQAEYEHTAFELDQLDKSEIVAFLRGTGASGAAWNAKLSALRSFYDFLKKHERVTRNPAELVDRHKTPIKEVQPLTLDEFLRLIDAAQERSPDPLVYRNVGLLQVLFHCGIRVAELVSLNVDQVDFENTVFLGLRVKGDKRLNVHFNDAVAEALERVLRDRARLGPPDTERALFLSKRRTRLSVRMVQEFIRRYTRLAGIKRRVTPHILRHSSATVHVELGTPLPVLRDMFGHASIQTTQRYTHVSDRQRQDAADALGKSFERARKARQQEKGDAVV